LGNLYQYDLKDEAKAEYWYAKAAEKNDSRSLAYFGRKYLDSMKASKDSASGSSQKDGSATG
jgi:TPR repeat protein